MTARKGHGPTGPQRKPGVRGTRGAYSTLRQKLDARTITNGECWEVRTSPDKDGYGKFRHMGKEYRAHRAAWEIHNGPIPPGLYVLHRCDNPACVRPSHLFVGSAQDNAADREAKSRGRYGLKRLYESIGQKALQRRNSNSSSTCFDENGDTAP